MINLEFLDEDGERVSIVYSVEPSMPVIVPAGTARVVVWLGTTERKPL